MEEQTTKQAPSKERFLWLGLSAVLILTGALLLYRIFMMQSALQQLRRQEQALTVRMDSLKARIGPEGKIPQNQITLPDFEKDELQHKGLTDPTQDLIKDLILHPELIPEPAVLGGTMTFSVDEAFILTDKWLFTSFSDGHVKGYILLEYEVSNSGKISWKVIQSYLLE
jgi:hypothetical protein